MANIDQLKREAADLRKQAEAKEKEIEDLTKKEIEEAQKKINQAEADKREAQRIAGNVNKADRPPFFF